MYLYYILDMKQFWFGLVYLFQGPFYLKNYHRTDERQWAQEELLDCLAILRNFGNCIPNNRMYHVRRRESSNFHKTWYTANTL